MWLITFCYVPVADVPVLSPHDPRIQRAWRASMSHRGNWQGQDKSRTSDHQDETVPSESLQDPVLTTSISRVRLMNSNSNAYGVMRHLETLE